MSRFESVQRPSVIGFLIVLEIVIGPTNSSQSDTIQVKSSHIVKLTDWCYKLDYIYLGTSRKEMKEIRPIRITKIAPV